MLETKRVRHALTLKVYLVSATAVATPPDTPDYDWLYQSGKVKYIEQIVNFSTSPEVNAPLELYPVVYGVEDTEEALQLIARLREEGFTSLASALQVMNWQSNEPLISLINLLLQRALFANFLDSSFAVQNILTAYEDETKIKMTDPDVRFILWIQKIFAHYAEAIEDGTIEESALRFIYARQSIEDELFSVATQNPACLSIVSGSSHLYEAAQLLPAMQLPGISTLAQAITHIGHLPCALQLSNAAEAILVAAGSVYESGANEIQIPPGNDNLYTALLSYLYNHPSGLAQHAEGIATYIVYHSVYGIGSPPPIIEGCDELLLKFLNTFWRGLSILNTLPPEDILVAIYDPQSIPPLPDPPPPAEKPSLSVGAQEVHDRDLD